MNITASIVVYNTPESQLNKILNCLKRSDIKCIWIVCNGLNMDYLNNISDEKIKIIYTENRGYGVAHNIALRKAMELGSIYHLVVNADIWWDGEILSDMAKYMDVHKDVALLSPKTFYPDGAFQYTCRLLPAPWDMCIRLLFPENMFKGRRRKYLLIDLNHDEIHNVPYLLGCFMFFRISILKEMGIFDERFFMYPEDIDITRRLHSKYKTIYWPLARIIHEHKRESHRNIRMCLIHLGNMVKYFNKWGWSTIKDNERKRMNSRILNKLYSKSFPPKP